MIEEVTRTGNAGLWDDIVEGDAPIGSTVFTLAVKDLVNTTARQLCCKVEGRAKTLGINTLKGVLGTESAYTIIVCEHLLTPLPVHREAVEFLASEAVGDNFQAAAESPLFLLARPLIFNLHSGPAV